MQWKLTHRHNHECIENKGGKTLSYDPNLGIQIIEQDGFAFKDLDNNGRLDPYEDWRLPLTQRIQDFTSRFVLWQEGDCLYYRKGRIELSREFCDWMKNCDCRTTILQASDLLQEDEEYLRENYILAMLLLMFDNDFDMGKEDYLRQLIVQSMDLGVLENIIYSIMEALKKYVTKRSAGVQQELIL